MQSELVSEFHFRSRFLDDIHERGVSAARPADISDIQRSDLERMPDPDCNHGADGHSQHDRQRLFVFCGQADEKHSMMLNRAVTCISISVGLVQPPASQPNLLMHSSPTAVAPLTRK